MSTMMTPPPSPTTPKMTTSSVTPPVSFPISLTGRMADYLELTKPRIAVMALITVTIGFTLGSAGNWQFSALLHALFGITLVAASSSAINQWWERESDRLMPRTANRPLPAGRLQPAQVMAFGLLTGVLGVAYLALFVNLLTAVLSLVTLLLYTVVYTPLKRRTSLCTTLGAIPGALPPVLGWTAASGQLEIGALALFAILFLWQFPHFLAIAWMYRNQYAEANLKMLPTHPRKRHFAGWLAVLYALVLLPVSLLPSQLALAGNLYFLVALGLGVLYLLAAIRFYQSETVRHARGLLYTSLLYLPLLLMVLTCDYLQLLR